MWLIRRERSAYVDQHGKDAINFQISTLIYSLVLIAIGFFGFLRSLPMLDSPHVQVSDMPLFVIMPIAILLFALLWLAWFIEVILAAVAAASGKTFDYIGSIRFIT